MVASFVSWPWAFVLPIAVSVLGLAASAGLLPTGLGRQAGEARRALDPFGAILATGGIVLASFGLITSHDTGWGLALVLGSLAAGVALLVVFLIVQRWVEDPLLPPAFLPDPLRTLWFSGMLLTAPAALLIEFLLLTYLQQIRGWTPFETAASFVPFALALIGTNILAAPTVVGSERKPRLSRVSCSSAPVSRGSPSWIHGPRISRFSCGIALVLSGAAVLAADNVSQGQMCLAGGVMNTAMELGPTVGFALLMALAATGADIADGYARAFAAAAGAYGVAAMAALLVAIWRRRHGKT